MKVFTPAMKKTFFLGFSLLLSNVMSKEGFWPFLPVGTWSGSNRWTEVYPWSFYWKL